ncbi:hypothetical protein [Hymenobacter sp. B81]|uniref:hypothetical protein n=1 Tax=Hymenobacter sp. B81 TaxID=3344878 RepID=UPI0037DD118B
MKASFSLALLFLSAQAALAQTEPAELPELKTRPFQLSLLPPLSTNGLEAGRVVNRMSLNLFGGYNGGVQGFEAGGFFNLNKHDVQGCQLAGFVNGTGGAVAGAQLAGFVNANAGPAQGLQAAGFGNVSRGGQVVQLGGFFNVAQTAKAQVAGFVNVARRVEGLQLGFINICDSTSGVPIGFINVVRRGGLRQFELAASDALHTTVSFKLGTPRLYTVVAVGRQFDSRFHWGYGLGLGTQQPLGRSWALSHELRCYSMTNKYFNSDRLDLLAQYRPTLSRQLASHLSVFVGPSVNVSIADRATDGQPGSRLNIPYSLYENEGSRTRVVGWIGATAGISL